jgi:hypothetical protein
MSLKNEDMKRIFKCDDYELAALKTAFKELMEKTYVNGKPFLGQLASVVDKNGALRRDMWDDVASESTAFNAMLSGDRWGWGKPRDWDKMVRQAKAKIFDDHNCEARKRQKRRRLESNVDAAHYNRGSDIRESEVPSRKRPRGNSVATPSPTAMRIELPADDPFVDTISVQTGQSAEFSQWSKSSNGAALPVTRNQWIRMSLPPSKNARISTPVELPLPRHRSSSTNWQKTGGNEVAVLRRRIETLERNTVCHSDLNHWSVVLETAVLDQVRACLAKRDAEIEALKVEVACHR